MPLYEYSCEKCGAAFEEIVRAEDAAPACPQCGARDTQKLIAAPSPLKTGAFPFKPGPVRPLANKMGGACGCACGSCGEE